jgi:hypothetical protein
MDFGTGYHQRLEDEVMMQFRTGMWAACVAMGILGPLGTFGHEFEISRSTIDGGGMMFSTGGGFELSGTIGQPDTGVMEGDVFTLVGGFWFREPLDDCNGDGLVNLIDYDDFEECLSGPGGGLPEPDCSCFDLDADVDIDLQDVARFQAEFAGL